MMIRWHWLLAGIAILLLSACMAEYEDISSQALYRNIVGKQFKSTSTLQIYGVTLDRNYAPIVGVYTIHGPPGVGGPEILSVETLPVGTVFNVTAVRRCTNCPFDEIVDIILQLPHDDDYDDAPVTISYELFETNFVTISP